MRCKPSLTRRAAHLSVSKLEASWRTSWRPLIGVHRRVRRDALQALVDKVSSC